MCIPPWPVREHWPAARGKQQGLAARPARSHSWHTSRWCRRTSHHHRPSTSGRRNSRKHRNASLRARSDWAATTTGSTAEPPGGGSLSFHALCISSGFSRALPVSLSTGNKATGLCLVWSLAGAGFHINTIPVSATVASHVQHQGFDIEHRCSRGHHINHPDRCDCRRQHFPETRSIQRNAGACRVNHSEEQTTQAFTGIVLAHEGLAHQEAMHIVLTHTQYIIAGMDTRFGDDRDIGRYSRQ